MVRSSKDGSKGHYGWREESERDDYYRRRSTNAGGGGDRYRDDSYYRRDDGHHGGWRDDREYDRRRDSSRSNGRSDWNDPQRNRGESTSNFEQEREREREHRRENSGVNVKNEDEAAPNETGNTRDINVQGSARLSAAVMLEDIPMEPMGVTSNTTVKLDEEAGKRKNDTSFASIAASRPEMVTMKSADNFARPPKKKSRSEHEIINKTNWASATLDEKLRSQYPRDIMNLHIQDQIEDDDKILMDKKIAAATYSLQKIRGEIDAMNEKRNEEPSDSEASDERPYHGMYGNKVDLSPPGISIFVSSLPYCILLDQGFKLLGAHPDDFKYCFCPCSKQMVKWRKNFDLGDLSGTDKCENFRQNSPNAFMDHLRKIGEDESAFHHRAVLYYLEKLYSRYWHDVSPGVDHKALHAVSTAGYKNAEAAERKFLMRAIDHWRAENLMKEKELVKKNKRIHELDQLKNTNQDLHARCKQLESNFQELNIKYEKKAGTGDIPPEEEDNYKRCVPNLIEAEKCRVLGKGKDEGKDKGKDKAIVISTPPIINIQGLFDEWFQNGIKDDTYLFRSLSYNKNEHYHAYKFLRKWTVKIGPIHSNTDTKEDRAAAEEITAIDQGGPTRAFVSAFCDQVGDLVIRIPIGRDTDRNGSKLKLGDNFVGTRVSRGKAKGVIIEGPPTTLTYSVEFEESGLTTQGLLREDFTLEEDSISLFDCRGPSGLVPQRDVYFKNSHDHIMRQYLSEMEYDEVKAKTERYYRAIGRFFLHIIFDDQVTLSSKVLPDMLRNVILRGVLPQSTRYSMSDLAIDLQNMDTQFSMKKQNEIIEDNEIKREKGVEAVNTFSTWQVDKELLNEHCCTTVTEDDSITTENFKTFVDFFALKTRNIAIKSLTEGMTDALGSLAQASSKAGFTRPFIKTCPSNVGPGINIVQGRHPCVEFTHSGGDFIPNDLSMGDVDADEAGAKILLLSGANMGGKSTLLRQTCLIAILAQIGCFVPAEECTITPFDRIFTRLGASDRILLGQSTFFVELAETAAALRGATRRSLVIMDELGRGTSTFDGTAIASAAVKHLIETNQCLTLFATHYHSLLEDWKNKPSVRLGHMECFVHEKDPSGSEEGNEGDEKDSNITFLYTLGEGGCPKSFGINVARLAGLPEEVLDKAKHVSSSFEESMAIADSADVRSDSIKQQIAEAVAKDDWDAVEQLWESLQG